MAGRRPKQTRGIIAPGKPVEQRAIEVDVTDAEIDDDHEIHGEGYEVTGSFANVIGARLDVSESVFRSVTFTGTRFQEFTATDVIFDGCEFSGSVLDDASCTRVEFRTCRLRAASFGSARLRDVRFVDCQLDEVSLRLCRGEHVGWEDSSMAAADLYGAQFAATHLFDCDCTGADFSQAKLPGALLHGCTLEGVRGVKSLGGVVIDSTQAVPLGLLLVGAAGIRIDDDRTGAGT